MLKDLEQRRERGDLSGFELAALKGITKHPEDPGKTYKAAVAYFGGLTEKFPDRIGEAPIVRTPAL